MQEVGRTRYRHANPLDPAPVLALRFRLADDEAGTLPPATVRTLTASIPAASARGIRLEGGNAIVGEALQGPEGRFLAAGLLLQFLLEAGGCRASAWGVRRAGKRSAVVYAGWDDWAVADAAAAELVWLLPALDAPEPRSLGTLLEAAVVRMRRCRLDQTGAALVAAAAAQGIPWRRVGAGDSLLQLGWGARQALMRESLIGGVQALPFLMARDKPSTSARLRQLGLPAPEFRRVLSADQAVVAARQLGGRVVVKPVGSSKANGVATGLQEEAAVRSAYEAARRYGEVMIERHVEGADHRLLVVGGRLLAAAQRIPGGVIGDGRRSVAALVAALNRDPRRGRGFEKLLNILEIDAEAQSLLARQKLTPDSVPAARQWVPLRRVGNISQGGIAIDVTDRIHPENAAAAVAAAEALGLPVAGVDFISRDISRPFRENGAAICEVNGCPGLRPHWVGDPKRDVVTPILRLAFGEGDDGRIPVAAVTGTHGKTTTARMLATIWGEEGGGVGLATTDGVQLDGAWLAHGDFAGVNGADLLFAHPRVRAAVLESARGGILRRGFAFDRCDVAAVICVDDDHLGEHGVATTEDMARVKARLVRLARRAVALNAADPLVRAMAAEKHPDARLLWVLPPDAAANVGSEELRGERVEVAAHAGEDWILHREEAGVTPLIAVSALPSAAAAEGPLPFNLLNACMAAALALGLGLSPQTIAGGLGRFRLGGEQSLGRYQTFDAAGRRVLLDFAHNPRQVGHIAALLGGAGSGGRRLCAFTAPGNRLEPVYAEVAAAVAGRFDVYIPYERIEWRRQRPAGEVSQLLAAGLASTGVAGDAIHPARTQADALQRLFALSRPGDLLVCLGAESHAAARQIAESLRDLEGRPDPSAATNRLEAGLQR